MNGQITLNGEAHTLAEGIQTVRALIDSLALGAMRVAVEINGTVVPRARHTEQTLAPGDRVEIVTFVGGG